MSGINRALIALWISI